MLFVTDSDDGRGIEIERVRQKIIDRKMTTPKMAEKLTDAEVFELLFLPGFSSAKAATTTSRRLDFSWDALTASMLSSAASETQS